MTRESPTTTSEALKTSTRRWSSDTACLVALTAIWLAAAFVVNPVGEFPLNDDWAYAWSVRGLLERGEFRISDWASTNLFPQVMWGALFSLPYGFSFTALRLSTLVLGWIGILATFGILREARASAPMALLGSLLLALNPLYLACAYSFNTDVPSLALSMGSLFFLVRGLRLDSSSQVGVGIALSLLSVANRQSGIFVLIAFGVAVLVKRGMTVRTAVLAATPAASAVLLNSAYSAWLAWNDKVPWLHGYHISQLANTLSSGIGHVGLVYAGNLVTIGVYLGLFLIPLVLLACLALRASSDGWPRRVVPLVAAIGIVLGIVLISARGPMPYAGNVLNTFGLGPETVDGYHSILTARERASVHRMWVAFTLLGTAGALVLLTLLAAGLVSAVRDRTRDDRRWMLALHAVTSAGYLFAIAGLEPSVWFDRYLLFPIPALMAIAVLAAEPRDMRVGRPWVISAWIALLLSGSLSVAATHDYLSWNRVRWGALTRLTQQGIKPEQIDGGFEFNGWFFGNRIELCNPRLARSEDHPEPGWNDFTCVFGTAEDTRRVYRLTFVPTQGFEVVDRVPVSRWLPRTDQPLYVLKRPEWFLK